MNVIKFTGSSKDFRHILDEAVKKAENEDYLAFPYYICKNCGFSAWTVSKLEEHRCRECGFPVKLIRTIEKQQDKPIQQEEEIIVTELVSTRHGFKKIEKRSV